MKKHYIIANAVIIFVLLGLSLLTFGLYMNGSIMASNTDKQAHYNGASTDGGVALMVNVYWGEENLDSMLATLEKYNAKITFFFGGSWVNQHPDILKKICQQGHEIANHGYFHKDSDKLTVDKLKEEIVMCQTIIEAHLEHKTTLFAPPSGAMNKTTVKVATELGYEVIMWSKDTIDWRDKDADLVYSRATKNIKAGDFVLMHPTPHTAAALPRILEYYKTNALHAEKVGNMI